MASDKKSSSNQTSNYNPLDLNLWELTCFIQVAGLRGFSKASTVLAIAQPTLSRYVRNLEKHLGTYLFHRTGRGVLLTDAGQILFEQGKNILAQVRNTQPSFLKYQDPRIIQLSLEFLRPENCLVFQLLNVSFVNCPICVCK